MKKINKFEIDWIDEIMKKKKIGAHISLPCIFLTDK